MRRLITLALLLPMMAQAHEGHGSGSATSIWHYLAEPMHLAPLTVALAGGIGYAAIRRYKRASVRNRR
ncbi:MAG: hypothetical protein U5O39_10625 [Gammaproteobacteria bacterium]|nr:hypothetical protein [Gammaproteobacteria bacterium]